MRENRGAEMKTVTEKALSKEIKTLKFKMAISYKTIKILTEESVFLKEQVRNYKYR